MAKNYYLLLGIPADASQEDVKKAYRRLANEYHPDHYGEDGQPFRDIQEAYSVLGNPKNRKDYDRARSERAPVDPSAARAEPLIPRRKSSPLRDLAMEESFDNYQPSFDSIFNRLYSNFFNVQHPKSEQPQSLNVEVLLDPTEARRGGEVRLDIPVIESCSICYGRGEVGFIRCRNCAGQGRVIIEKSLYVAFPAGLSRDYTQIIALNQYGINNLYLTIQFRIGSG